MNLRWVDKLRGTRVGRHRKSDPGRRVHKAAALLSTLALVAGAMTLTASAASADEYPGTDSWLSLYTLQDGTIVGCIDPGRAYPGESGWVNYTATQYSAPHTAYIWAKYGQSPNANQRSALEYLSQNASDIPHDGSASPAGHGTPAVVAVYNAMMEEADQYAGPYTITGTVTDPPTATDGTVTARFHIESHAETPMSGYDVSFTTTGSAGNLNHTSATTNGSGDVTVTYHLDNNATGGVKAVANGLPATSVTMYLESGATTTQANHSSNRQRMIGRSGPSSASDSVSAHRDKAPTSKVSVHKTDAANGHALAGAKIEVVKGTDVLATGTTNSSGDWTSPALDVEPGTKVRIHETKAPSGYYRNTDTFFATTTTGGGGSGKVTIKDTPQGKISVHKTDAATGNDLKGAEFEVHKDSATGTVVASGTTNASGDWTSGYLANGVNIGDTVWIVETKAPKAYTKAPGAKTAVVTRDGSGKGRVTVADDRSIAGFVRVMKVDSVTGDRIKGATFTVQVQKAGTSTWTTVTGGAQAGTTEPTAGHYSTNGSGYAQLNGNATSPKLAYGDKIRFTEVATAPGYIMPPANKRTVTGTIGTDLNLTVNAENTPYQPKIGTTAVNADSDMGKMVVGGDTVTDTVSYSDVQPGQEYRVDGELILVDADGNATPTGIKASSDVFTPAGKSGDAGASGTVDVNFELPTTLPDSWVADYHLVVFETMVTTSNGKTYASHKNANDKGQTVYFPAIHTTAQSSNPDLGKTVVGGVQLTDTIAYKNLTPGKKYTAKGEFQVVDADGNATPTGITGQATFTPEQSSGTVTVTFDVPDDVYAQYAGQKLVAFESVSLGDVTLAIHADVADEGQTVYVPEIHTTAQNADEAYGKMASSGGQLVDTVAYENLQPGTEYTATGEFQIVDEDGNATPSGITGEATFTPESASGTVDVTFDVPADLFDTLAGDTLVAFETVSVGDVAVAIHADVTDEGQTVYVPEIGTTAVDSETGSHNVSSGSITDTIAYCGLQPGKEYTASGEFQIVDEDGNATPSGITGEATFTPDAPCGSVDVTFEVPDDVAAQVAGDTLVAFETVKQGEATVAIHADVTDEDQTVYVPEIHTTAQNALDELGKTAQPGGTVTDVVSYSGLQPGTEYTMSGEFMVLIDGKVVATGITGEQTFTPETSSGTVTVTFQAPDSADYEYLLGTNPVAFETLREGDVVIAVHTDINDEGQSVNVPKIGTTAVNQDTGLGKVVTPGSTLVDTIAYENLNPGTEYTASGEFQLVKDGKATATGITGKATFTPKTASGTVDVTFKVPAKLKDELLGAKLVAFETVSQGDVVVAIHADVTDKGQTVYVPNIGTTAANANAKLGKVVVPGGKLVDTIAYSGLQPGQKYTASGEFQVVGKDGKATPTGVTGKAVFTPKTSDGTVDVTFQVPDKLKADLTGHSWVAFETVGVNGKTVAIHADVTDQAQTVYAPEIGTSLYGPNKENGPNAVVNADGGVRLVDTIAYSGLQPGQKYTATGKLMFADGTSTGITNSVEFTAKTSDGTVDVPFTVPADKVGPNDTLVVAFESVALSSAPKTPVATHKDLHAKSQQVTLGGITGGGVTGGDITSGLGAEGGGSNPLLLGGGIALLVLLAGAGVFLVARRRRQGTAEEAQ